MKNLKKTQFSKKTFLKNLILVTGTHTSGKSMISPIIASLNDVEMLRKIYYLDQIAMMNFFKAVSPKAAKFLGNHILDLSFYEQLIGRNMNFRYEDETSVTVSKNPNFYKKRLKIKRGPEVIKYHHKRKTYMLLDTHDGVWFNKFWYSLCIQNLKIINISRNPIDIVNSWVNADLGQAEKQLLCQIPLIKEKKKLKPFYLYKNLKNKKLNKNEIIIEMVCTCVEEELRNYEKIKKNKNIIRIDFDNFAKYTNFYLKKITKFIGKQKTKYTAKILKRERLPRKIHQFERLKKLNKIKKKVKKKFVYKLLNLEKKYLDHLERGN
tara:strand:+ start:11750 stop:12715 length:966 start_codon:yes stop_codon:yes gene_type:complete